MALTGANPIARWSAEVGLSADNRKRRCSMLMLNMAMLPCCSLPCTLITAPMYAYGENLFRHRPYKKLVRSRTKFLLYFTTGFT